MYAISPKGIQASVTSLAGPLKTCLLISLLLEGLNNHCHVILNTCHLKYILNTCQGILNTCSFMQYNFFFSIVKQNI